MLYEVITNISIACGPSSAVSTRYPCIVRICTPRSRIISSSSTKRIVSFPCEELFGPVTAFASSGGSVDRGK